MARIISSATTSATTPCRQARTKNFITIEGAVHGSVKNLFDCVAKWLNDRF